jgi:hypothetical protein
MKYRHSIITFCDILGFSDLVKTEENPKNISQKIKLLRHYTLPEKEFAEELEAKSYHFSDTVVRITPLDSKLNMNNPIGLLFHEIIDIVHAQMELANNGIFLRGGLTLGEVYYDDEQLFGPGINTAYRLESQLALYPRIIIDPHALAQLGSDDLLKKDTHTPKQEGEHIRKLLRQDSDGLWFIDYLLAANTEADDPETYINFLDGHKNRINQEIKRFKQMDRVAQKLSWLITYHNSTIKQLQSTSPTPKGINWKTLLIKQHPHLDPIY